MFTVNSEFQGDPPCSCGSWEAQRLHPTGPVSAAAPGRLRADPRSPASGGGRYSAHKIPTEENPRAKLLSEQRRPGRSPRKQDPHSLAAPSWRCPVRASETLGRFFDLRV